MALVVRYFATVLVVGLSACSRSHRVPEVDLDPLPHPDRIYVDLQSGMGHGESHYITDPTVLARIDTLMHVDRGGWRDIYKEWGKAPIWHAILTWSAGDTHLRVKVGTGWLMRDGLLHDMPMERTDEILALIGDDRR